MNRVIRSVCAIMEEETGKGQALRIRERAQKRYEALCAENAGDSRALRAHTYSRIYPCIALYQAMIDDGIDSKKAYGYIGEYFQRIARVMEPHVQRMARLPGMASRMPAFFMKIAEKMFGTNAGFVYEFPKAMAMKHASTWCAVPTMRHAGAMAAKNSHMSSVTGMMQDTGICIPGYTGDVPGHWDGEMTAVTF